LKNTSRAASLQSPDRQQCELVTFTGQYSRFETLRRADEQDTRHFTSSFKFSRHRQPGKKMAAGSSTRQNHSHARPGLITRSI
jgi:hypothetical protein